MHLEMQRSPVWLPACSFGSDCEHAKMSPQPCRGGTPESAVPSQPGWAYAAVYVANGVLVCD